MGSDEDFLAQAIALAHDNVTRGGRPFGALVVDDRARVIATGVNELHTTSDPTTHAELQAIRAGCKALGRPRLDGCIVYASGQPCPMCLSAMYLAGVGRLLFAYSNDEGEPYGLSTSHVYAELVRPLAEQSMSIVHRPARVEGMDLYEAWRARSAAGR
jgi:tRNA(Arg) A34 adenosine deaminase TadA